jgi:hypothetical protein
MKNSKAVAKRIAEFHNEGIRPVKRTEEMNLSVEKASRAGEKVIRLSENAVENTSARTTEETMELNRKLLEFAHINTRAYFEWLHGLVAANSPSVFIALCMKYSPWLSSTT